MTAISQGGAAKRVKVLTAADLKANGGSYALEGRPPIAVYGVSEAETKAQGGQFAVEGNIAQPVYIVDTPDGAIEATIAPIPMIAVDGTIATGNVAIPVYVVAGSLGGLDPVTNLELTATGSDRELITATYDAVAGATDYEYEYSPDGVTYTPIGTTALLAFDLDDTEYDIGIETHYVRVRAVGGDDWTIATLDDLALVLVAAWGLNQASGNEPSLLAGGATATEVGTVGSTAGLFGDARTFSGENGLSVADSADVSMGAGVRFTIVLWANPTATGDVLIAKRRPDPVFEYQFDTDSGTLRLIVSSDGTTGALTSASGGTVSTGSWQMLLAGYDGANIYTSINAGSKNTTAFSADVADTGSAFVIGGQLFLPGITGAMAQVLVYKRALSATNESRLFNGGVGLDITTVLP